MDEVFKSAVKVETGEAEQSVKRLKQKINDLRDEILNLEKGTQEYNDAVQQLQSDQRKLNEVMSLTKKDATALDGSYDALTYKMSQLKKEWKSTNDEAKRNELGKQISEINAELKEMDASIGNFQRNVGDYANQFGNAYQKLRKEIKQYQAEVLNAEEGSEEWTAAMQRLSDAQFQMRDMNEKSRYSVADFGEQLSNVVGIASGLMSGFSAVQGAMALCGAETQDFEKVMIKLQSAMAIVQGLQGLEGINDRIDGLTQSIKTAAKSMGKGGWIGIIIAVGTVVAALTARLVKKNKEIKNGTAQLKEYNKIAAESVKTVGDEVAKLKLLEKIATDVTESDENRNRAAKELLKTLGESINATTILAAKNGEYKKAVDDLTNSLMQQAMVEASLDKLKEYYGELLSLQTKLEQRQNNAPTGWDKFRAGFANAAMNAEPMGSGIEVDAEDYKNDGVNKIQKDIDAVQLKINQFTDAVRNMLPTSGILEVITGDEEQQDGVVKTLQERLDEILNTMIEEIVIDDPEIEMPEVPELEDKNGQAEQRASFLNGLYEKQYQRQIDYNRMSLEDEETKAQREYEINLELQEKKLENLKRFQDEAWANNDVLGALELAEQIKDQELEIDKAKYEEKLRLDEQYKEKKIKISEQINQAISAAANVTQGILEITQAAYEKDGEISEEEAKKIKGMQIAIATMNMLAGITAALSGVFTTKTGPWDIAMAAVQAATIAASGTANIMKIKNTDLTGSVSSGAQPAVTPNSNIYGTDLPMSYVRNVTGASEVEELNKDTRVYILESDIQASNKRVQVRESESSF